jgi:hypothetical protein
VVDGDPRVPHPQSDQSRIHVFFNHASVSSISNSSANRIM